MDDLEIAHKYTIKCSNALKGKFPFELSFAEFKKLMKQERCSYTNMVMTDKNLRKPLKVTDRTLERVDNSLGYTASNTVAVCSFANDLKGRLENPSSATTMNHLVAFVYNVRKLQK